MATVVTTTAALGLTGVRAGIFADSLVICSAGSVGLAGQFAQVRHLGRVFQNDTKRIRLVPIDVSLPGHPIVVDVLSWSPAGGDDNVELGRSARVNFRSTRSNEHQINYSGTADFNLGVYNDTVLRGEALELAENIISEDFESMSTSTPPAPGWSTLLNSMYVESFEGRKSLQGKNSNDRMMQQWSAQGDSPDDRILTIKFKLTSSTDQNISPAMRLTGSGSTLRGYSMEILSTNFSAKRHIGGTGTYGFGAVSHGRTLTIDQWWWSSMKMVGGSMYGKLWKEGESEPGSWTYIGDDTLHATGSVGVACKTSTASGANKNWCDEVLLRGVTPAYKTTGTWHSDWVDLSVVDRFSSARITWDETVPANTTAAIHLRRGTGGSWFACTNGDPLPGFVLDDGLRNEVVQIRVTLGTADSAATPTVDNLQIVFDPMDFDQLEIVVGGHSATMANRKLISWGKERVIGNGIQLAYDDLWCEASAFWLEFYTGPVTVQLRYVGVLVSEITFNAADLPWFVSGDLFFGNVGYFNFLNDRREANPNTVEWVCWRRWSNSGKNYEWILYDRTQGIHADGRFWVAHLQIDDHPGSAVLAALNLSDHVGSAVYKGYVRDDHAGSALVQGDRLDDHPGSALVGDRDFVDYSGSAVVGELAISDHVGSAIYYAVNREGHLEYDVITDETWTQMLADGFVMA